jgi:S-DNA-T family DNA segregation ATPase FtsK/SpoIIIE
LKIPWLATPEKREDAAIATPSGARSMAHSFAREASAIVLFSGALFSALALVSYRCDPSRPHVEGSNWVGPVGASIAEVLVTAVGAVSWLVPVELALIGRPLLDRSEPGPTNSRRLALRIVGDVAVATLSAALLHVAFAGTTIHAAMPIAGTVGELAGELMRALFSAVGSFIIGATLIALILINRASFSFIEATKTVGRFAEHLLDKGVSSARTFREAWLEAKTHAEAEKVSLDRAIEARIVEDDHEAIIATLCDDDRFGDTADVPAVEVGRRVVPPPVVAPEPTTVRSDKSAKRRENPTPSGGRSGARSPSTGAANPEPPAFSLDEVPTPSPIMPVQTAKEERKPRARPKAEPARAAPAPSSSEAIGEPPAKPSDEIVIVDTSAAREVERVETKMVPAIGEGFRLPSFDFLDGADASSAFEVNGEQLKQTAIALEKTLSDYGVSGKVEEIHPGPTVTTFEVVPAAGTKVSKVASLADDLALGLSRKVRIIAPIPGKNRIGFEVPNPKRAPVSFRELVEDRRFVELGAPLPCVMGRDIVGAPYFADLASMPHVIVAGATGAGKSVGLNVILVSLLYRRTPEELRLLMIDPKVVELAPYDGIPHMLLPVVTDMKQAANALRWAVDEMERRYQLFANAGTKNITTYNGFVERVLRGEARAPKPPSKPVSAQAADGTFVDVPAAQDGSDVEPITKLPYIVIVVDEFADLMMQQGKEVEASVARLAQKARAAGMHVILATQRPSVDVITGMIKANFPTRVAFRVSQKVDSRTILDEQGAEHLLGRGDMLVKMNGTNDVRRVQCPFISEEETQRVTDFLRLQGKPVYDENILKPRDEDGAPADDDDGESDALYDQAVRIVAETRRCSTSWLQRKLAIGYNRAAKLVETMERRGLVGPANGAKDREVLVDPI